MEFKRTDIPEVMTIEPQVYTDRRGFLMETWRQDLFANAGINVGFVQDVHSQSTRNTLRGLHFQVGKPQGKLLRVLSGEIFDVAVDLRRSSRSFGQWVGVKLSAENRRIIWVPEGFAHGFLVLSERADVEYRLTNFYAPELARAIRWDDPDIGIDWPLVDGREPLLSDKDAAAGKFSDADTYA